VDDGEDFLHAAEREDRDEERAAALDGVVDAADEAGDLGDASLPAGRSVVPRVVSVTRCRSGRRETWRRERALVFEEHVAGEEDRAVLVVDLDAAAPATWPAWWKMTSISSLAP
jgi:hypothetical protein